MKSRKRPMELSASRWSTRNVKWAPGTDISRICAQLPRTCGPKGMSDEKDLTSHAAASATNFRVVEVGVNSKSRWSRGSCVRSTRVGAVVAHARELEEADAGSARDIPNWRRPRAVGAAYWPCALNAERVECRGRGNEWLWHRLADWGVAAGRHPSTGGIGRYCYRWLWHKVGGLDRLEVAGEIACRRIVEDKRCRQLVTELGL
eukprot:scaffold197058_cov30-Tisochrysis_lutea.AAC.1